jgi:hypothetical protein
VLSIDGDMRAAEVRNARDTTPPRVERVEVTSLTRIEVFFNETVQQDGVANTLDTGDVSNIHTFHVGDTLTITLGASRSDNLTIPVHDSSMVSSGGISSWNHDRVWLSPANGSGSLQLVGFLRFEWQRAFRDATGGTDASDIVEVQYALSPEWGDGQTIEVRRTLQRWSDSTFDRDWNSRATGAPIWRDHQHPSERWNTAGVRALGGTGGSTSDYFGNWDLSGSVDATVTMTAINRSL